MTLIDANVILRYILNDIPKQAEQASKIIEKGAFTHNEIIAEVIYVLVKLYQIPRKKIKDILCPLLEEVQMDQKEVISFAIEKFSDTKFDFVDCILLARKKILHDDIFTFDKKLSNQLKRI